MFEMYGKKFYFDGKACNRITLILAVVFFILVCLNITKAHADESNIRIFTEAGGMNVNENDISEGHKSYHQLGIEYSIENMRARMSGQVDGFFMGEPPEEDPEIPKWGAGAQIEYAYKWKAWAFPYLGVRYDHIERELAPKYNDPNDPEYDRDYVGQAETEHDMVSARGGFHFQHKWMWADIGTIIPFYTSTKSGNFGPDVGVGVKFGAWDIGYRFKEYRLTDNHFEGDTALSFYFSGVQLGYTF